MSRQQLFAAFFLGVFLFLLYQFYQMFRVFLVPLTWAALLAVIFYPLQVRLVRLLGGRAGLAASIFTTAVILVVMAPTVVLSVVLANESVVLYQRLVEFLSSDQPQHVLDWVRHLIPQRVEQIALPAVQQWDVDVTSMAKTGVGTVSGFLVSQAADIAKNVAEFLLNFILTTFALFFFFRDGARIVGAIRDLLPMEPEYKDMLLARFYETVSAVVRSTLIIATTQGFMVGSALWALGVPFALIFGCATAFASFLPSGPVIVWGPWAIYMAATGSPWRALLLTLWGVLAVGVVDNVLRPLLIGGTTEIPTLLLFFGILGGLQAYGFLGLFLAPALIAVLVAVARIYQEQYGTAS